MNIDAHQHFWHYNPQRDGWITDEMSVLKRDFLPHDLIPELHANGMEGSLAVQADQSEQETMFLLELAEKHSEVKGVVGWVDLCSSNVRQRLEHFSRFEKLCGFRHVVQSEPDDRFMLRKEFLAGIAALREFDFTYDILIYPQQLPAAIELVEQFPEQAFVLDHIAKPRVRSGEISSWAEQIRKIAANPNLYCKLSGLLTEANWHDWRAADFKPYLDVIFKAFTPDRLMFGSDWPVCLLAGSYRRVKELIAEYVRELTRAQQDGILGWNAVRFYGLKISHHEPATAR